MYQQQAAQLIATAILATRQRTSAGLAVTDAQRPAGAYAQAGYLNVTARRRTGPRSR